MPEDETEEDFRCFTCSFSKFTRRQPGKGVEVDGDWGQEASWDPLEPDEVPDIGWRGGKGGGGGWGCEINGDCSFLQGGEERGWHFSGDEAFLHNPNTFNDKKNNTTNSDLLKANYSPAPVRDGGRDEKL